MEKIPFRARGRPSVAQGLLPRGRVGGIVTPPLDPLADLSSVLATVPGSAIFAPWQQDTLFQDVNGTTPVTAAGQPVGLMLDVAHWGGKSFSEVMASQPELVTNGSFTTDLEWILPSGWSISSGSLTASGLAAFSTAVTTALPTLTAGKAYYVVAKVDSKTGTFRTQLSGGATLNGLTRTDTGILTEIFIATASHTTLGIQNTTASAAINIDSISVKEIPSIVATRVGTDAVRPIYQLDSGSRPYLACDGSDDGMVTPSIDLSVYDKIGVFAGLRKLSDAATGIVTEFSGDVLANNGAFHIAAPTGAGRDRYQFANRGTATAIPLAVGFAAPHSAVLTGLGDISGDLATLWVNGVQVAQVTTDQGSGNYGNYPLYLFRRGGSSLPFNGHFYGLILWPGLTIADTDKVTQVEALLADKTGVTL